MVAVVKPAEMLIVVTAGDDLLARRPQHDAVLKLRCVAALDVAERGVPEDETVMKRYKEVRDEFSGHNARFDNAFVAKGFEAHQVSAAP